MQHIILAIFAAALMPSCASSASADTEALNAALLRVSKKAITIGEAALIARLAPQHSGK